MPGQLAALALQSKSRGRAQVISPTKAKSKSAPRRARLLRSRGSVTPRDNKPRLPPLQAVTVPGRGRWQRPKAQGLSACLRGHLRISISLPILAKNRILARGYSIVTAAARAIARTGKCARSCAPGNLPARVRRSNRRKQGTANSGAAILRIRPPATTTRRNEEIRRTEAPNPKQIRSSSRKAPNA